MASSIISFTHGVYSMGTFTGRKKYIRMVVCIPAISSPSTASIESAIMPAPQQPSKKYVSLDRTPSLCAMAAPPTVSD
eukprot:CAMPEP_0205951466 /NCGR_PEP_ID=MMETSP1459-20131121/2974_1 /ASSEMBLY_ACC=CAM_ASM_001120 /TAXON_ID=41880 /ORGANISM="Pycnococcus provasolii, Strain RCC931" /LENGTH=77 /DNA_ID=CAMNT_0053323181 /DNA_START=236 /DNA_END=466 /DNA_ORIENTATION=+